MKREQRVLDSLIRDLKEGNFKYTPRNETPINWMSYNLAQINEIKLVLLFIKNAVEEAAPPKRDAKKRKRRGREKRIPASDLAKAILVQQYFQKADRVAVGIIDLFREKLGITSDIQPRTLDRAYFDREVKSILKKVFMATSKPITSTETSFSTDTTGQPLSIKQNYANDRDNKDAHKGYDKMAVMVSNHFHIATAAMFGDYRMSDCPTFEPLLLETAERFLIVDVEADAGFLSRDNCTATSNAGAIPYIYPKEGITLNKKGSMEWRAMLERLLRDPQKWLETYHLRSNNESYFSSYKRRFPGPLLRKLPKGRRTEALARISIHNICMLIRAYFEHDVEVEEFRDNYL
ncbi:MAG: transposase [Nitrospirota bacterium]